ncbi:MAG: LLM class flavin-dependent oxidoreductase, partial [Rhizobacter sp.]
VMRATWTGGPVRHAGAHYLVDSPGLPAARTAAPPVWLGGASDAALQVAAARADVHALWGETPPMVAERIAELRALARNAGREVDSALRIHVIARATEAEAWAEAGRLLSAVPQSLVDVAQRQLARSESVGQQRMRGLHRGRTTSRVRDLEVYPNVWSGVGLVRGGAGTAIVGSHAQVAERIHEYRALGVNRFILSGYPNLEEAREVGDQVLPRVRGAPPRVAA